jgi:hypothetical protein
MASVREYQSQMNSYMKRMFPLEMTRVEKDQCPFCGISIVETEFKDAKSFKEYTISGMCQKCQDDFFKE